MVRIIWFVYYFAFMASFFVGESVQNQAPYFNPPLESTYFFPESNQTKVGDVLLHLSASDPDDDELEFGINGEFYNKLLTIKRVDSKHANVILNQPFDREVQEKYENIVFYVKDPPGNQILQAVRFVIVDIDDNAPVFINIPYKAEVYENAPINSIVYNSVSAYDLDGPLYNEFKFDVSESGVSENYFSIDTLFISSGHYNGTVKLIKQLDFEKQKVHLLNINANGVNSHWTSSTDLIINVLDSPDMPPEFSQSPYYFKIPEELPIGEKVSTIFAKDGDSGINNPCAYEINYQTSQAAQYFSIEKLTGELRIKKRIDRESEEINKLGDLLEFTVTAYEIGDEDSKSEVQVTVAIIDINDNDPVFDLNAYNLQIIPKVTSGTIVTILNAESINIHDLDKGINGSFTISLNRVVGKSLNGEYSYEDDNDFEVVPAKALNYANLNIRVKNANSVNSKAGQSLHYHISAHDNGINGHIKKADVFIKIEMINEYPPRFEREFYKFFVDENSMPNTTVDFIIATDADVNSGIYGKVHYELKNGQNRFAIDRESGRIYTISSNPTVELDRESIDTYYLSVDAIDGGGLRTSAKLIIKLNDLNDNVPQFMYPNSNQYFQGLIEENSVKWLEKIKLQSVDFDIGLNGVVAYSIVDGDSVEKFVIDQKTNKLTLKENEMFDFEHLYELKRLNKLYDVSSDILYMNDTANNDEVHLHLVIIARDLGTPSLASKTVVKIIVKDVNDNAPKFENKFYHAKVLETAISGDLVSVKATDLDAIDTPNSKVNYRIANGSHEKFIIDANSGMVKIMPNAQLDHDLYGSNYTLEIIANDFGPNLAVYSNNSQSNTDTCFVLIDIIDVNNKKPEFLKEINYVSIYEDINVNKTFIKMQAIDLDTNAKLFYYMMNDDHLHSIEAFDEYNRPVETLLVKSWFDIDSSSGDVYVKSPIDREIAGFVKLVVYVEDQNADENFKPQIAKAILNIKILDVNDNYPQIFDAKILDEKGPNDGPIYELTAHISENSKYATQIAQIRASDADLDRNITYTVPSSSKNKYLSVDELTGLVTVNDLIDYESVKWINMTIFVYDNGKPEQKYSTLLFYCRIDDLNDNLPTIDKVIAKTEANHEYLINTSNHGNATLRIKNNLLVGTEIAEIQAHDDDSGLNSELFFYFDETRSTDSKNFVLNSQTGKIYLNGKLNRENQTLFNLEIVVADRGSPQLKSRLLLRIVLTDEFNNAAIFHKKQICLSHLINCDNDYQTLIINKLEEQTNTLIGSFNFAKMTDSRKKDRDICYYLLGTDKDFFSLNKSSAVLNSQIKFDREKRKKYEVIIQASENCECDILNDLCDFSKLNTYDHSSLSRIKVRIIIDDTNDNIPYFTKTVFVIALSPEVDYGDVILEGEAEDLDVTSQINFTVIENSLIKLPHKKSPKNQKSNKNKFPFTIEHDETTRISQGNTNISDQDEISTAKFRLKTQTNFKSNNRDDDDGENLYYEFKIKVFDQNPKLFNTATVKIYILNKSQRLKLTFSHSIEYLNSHLDSLKSYLSNITGYKVNIDSIQTHPYLIHNLNETGEQKSSLTDIYMHFISDRLNSTDNTTIISDRLNFSIIPADNVINQLDRVKDSTLIRKYRLILAEQFNGNNDKENNVITFSTDQNPFSLTASSISSNPQFAQYLLVKLLLIILCIILTILIVFILIICFFMRRKYKLKLKTERAIIKTFDLSMISAKYNTANNNNIDNLYSYSNKAFINNADEGHTLAPYVTGTNLYSYEGTNPIWLKKYDKIETKSSSIRTNTSATESDSATSTASSYSKTIDTYKLNNKHRMINNNTKNNEIKQFYLKQTDSTVPSASTTTSTQNSNINSNNVKKEIKKTINYDHTLSITSNESNTANNIYILNNTTKQSDLDEHEYECHKNQENIETSNDIKNTIIDNQLNDLSSFTIQTSEKLRNCLLNRVDSLKYNKRKRSSNANIENNNNSDLIQLQETATDVKKLDNITSISNNNVDVTNNLNKISDTTESRALENTVI